MRLNRSPGDRSVDQMKEQVAQFAERELGHGQLASAVVAADDGQFVPIVGPAGTGNGKSTFAVLRLLDGI